jgi:hypothetical protein
MVKILDKIRSEAKSIPNTIIDIGSGLAGLFMPGHGGSAARHIANGNVEGAFNAATLNYVGIDVMGGGNSLGNMIRRAKGTQAVIIGKLFKGLVNELD